MIEIKFDTSAFDELAEKFASIASVRRSPGR